MIKYLIICPLVFLAGFIDAIAGGGGLISLPAYMIVGLPAHNAIATNKMSSTMGTSIATFKYARNGYISLKQCIPGIIGAIIGSTLGSNLALLMSDQILKNCMLIIIPFVAFYVLRTKNLSEDKNALEPRKEAILIFIISVIVGIYDGFYGPGTGTFLILLFTGLAHLKIFKANGVTKAINLSTNITALVVYLLNGKVILLLGIVAGVFNIAGNYIGATCFQKGGAKFTRPVILTVLVIFFAKLIFG